MTANFIVFEPEVKAFLIEKGVTGSPIYLSKFPEDSAAKAVMIRSDAISPPIPVEAPIDSIRVQVSVRDKHPLAAITLSTDIANLIHGATPGKLHATSSLALLSAVIDERPQRDDDDELDLPRFTAFYLFRVKPLT